MVPETAVAEILQESGCAERDCEVRIWVEDNRVHASHPQGWLLVLLTSGLDATDPLAAEDITTWLREKHR